MLRGRRRCGYLHSVHLRYLIFRRKREKNANLPLFYVYDFKGKDSQRGIVSSPLFPLLLLSLFLKLQPVKILIFTCIRSLAMVSN